MSRVRTPGPQADVREHLASKAEGLLLKWMRELGDHAAAERCARWIKRVRAGGEIVCHWYELPEGAFTQGGHNPCDYVVLGADDVTRWEGP